MFHKVKEVVLDALEKYTPQIKAFVDRQIAAHNHDGRYYTETETDAKLDEKASAVHTHSYLPLSGGTITGNIHTEKSNIGYFMTDSTGNSYPGIYDNGTNFWLGTTATAARHHTGSTFISSGYNAAASDGNASVFVSVPNASNDGGTNYPVLHSGNFTSYCPPKFHASAEATYGIGNASNYGHIKLSDSYTGSGGAASAGVGASSDALYNAYTALNNRLRYNGCCVDIGVNTLSLASGTDYANCAITDTALTGTAAEVYTLNAGGTIILKKAGTYILAPRIKCAVSDTAQYAFSVVSLKWNTDTSTWEEYKSLGDFRSDSAGNYMTVSPTSYIAAAANDRLLLRIKNGNLSGSKTMTFSSRIRLIYLAK